MYSRLIISRNRVGAVRRLNAIFVVVLTFLLVTAGADASAGVKVMAGDERAKSTLEGSCCHF